MKQPTQLQQLLERTKLLYPDIEPKKLFSHNHPTTFRVNRLRTTKYTVVSALSAAGYEIEPVSWYEDAFIMKNKSLRELTDTDIYRRGELYVQSLSSMIPPLVLAPKANDKILDLCAAPGSKTSQMAAIMKNTGEILANDNSRIRIYKLDANLKLLGVTNTMTHFGVGQTLWQQYPEYFDRTLVDVPCSMEGRIQLSDEKTYKDWSLKKIRELSERQRWLLRGGVSATKPGGVIVYSTCTLSPEENEGVIDWILKKEKGCLEVESISLGCTTRAGVTIWNGKAYAPDVVSTVRILPIETMEGFFVAKLRKTKSNIMSNKSIDRS